MRDPDECSLNSRFDDRPCRPRGKLIFVPPRWMKVLPRNRAARRGSRSCRRPRAGCGIQYTKPLRPKPRPSAAVQSFFNLVRARPPVKVGSRASRLTTPVGAEGRKRIDGRSRRRVPGAERGEPAEPVSTPRTGHPAQDREQQHFPHAAAGLFLGSCLLPLLERKRRRGLDTRIRMQPRGYHIPTPFLVGVGGLASFCYHAPMGT